MSEQADHREGQGTAPGSDLGLPERDPHLAGFALGGEFDACLPSASLALALESASGPEWQCAGATRDEMFGLLRQWQAVEARAVAGKLGILRALIREDDQPLPGGGYHGNLPEGWTKSLTHEVAAALSMPVVSADRLMSVAWDLEGRLPGVGGLLADGALTFAKAKAVDEALQQLSVEDAAAVEAMILPELPGKTYGQVVKLAVQAAITVDSESATRRREDAEQNLSRVTMFREESGAAGLSGRDMPTDQTLAAHASVCARAQVYAESGVFPAGTRMDQYRVTAYLDLLNGVAAHVRIASGLLPGDGSAADRGDAPESSDETEEDQHGEDAETAPPRLADLVVPLATLLGLAERPGSGHGLGSLDPDLCRDLATAAAGSQHSRLCVTVTDPDGIAIGHGCARAAESGKHKVAGDHGRTVALPARLNLTITAARLAELASTAGPPGRGSWAFTRDTDAGPPDGYGTWTLTLPNGRNLFVGLRPVPTFECDHRYESHAYRPNDTLRHLVQIRDGDCTFPTCSRHARESDFEHATPYDKGGRTCACNAGARSRGCHRVKQSPGWNVTQPKPGWHQWITPSGRAYIQGPKHYPA
jgi:hypothetical protein